MERYACPTHDLDIVELGGPLQGCPTCGYPLDRKYYLVSTIKLLGNGRVPTEWKEEGAWLVIRTTDYEGDQVEGVFATQAAAEAYVVELGDSRGSVVVASFWPWDSKEGRAVGL